LDNVFRPLSATTPQESVSFKPRKHLKLVFRQKIFELSSELHTLEISKLGGKTYVSEKALGVGSWAVDDRGS